MLDPLTAKVMHRSFRDRFQTAYPQRLYVVIPFGWTPNGDSSERQAEPVTGDNWVYVLFSAN